MWFLNLRKVELLQALLALVLCTEIEALAARAAEPSNSTLSSSSTTKTTSTSSTTTSTSTFGTITAAPTTYAWGNQSIPLNTCSFTANQGNIEYEPCSVQAGSIQLSYFPEPSGNVTYPTTHYVPEWDITMTSPSIYMLLNTITGFNDCGPLGPTFVNKVISMLITDVSTLPPYADSTTHDRYGSQEQQLTLSDLLDCPSFSTVPAGASTDPHPVSNVYNRCNPYIKMPEQASEIGYPYWVHCAPVSYRMGVFDPPGSVPPVNGLFATTTSAAPYTPTPDPPSAVPVVSSIAAVTAVVDPAPVSSAASTAVVDNTPLASPASPATPVVTAAANSAANSAPQAVPLPATQPASSTVIATIAGQVVSAAPGASTVQIGTQVVTAGGAEVTLSGGNVVTLGPSGSLLVKLPSGTTSLYIIPTAAPVDTELAGASWVVNAGSSAVVVGTQTAYIGGPALTLSNHDVVSLGSSGLNIQMPGGTVSTLVPSVNMASIIAAIVGATLATTSAVSSSTSSGLVNHSSGVVASLSSSHSTSYQTASSSTTSKKATSISPLSSGSGTTGASSIILPASGAKVEVTTLPIATASGTSAATFTGAGLHSTKIWSILAGGLLIIGLVL